MYLTNLAQIARSTGLTVIEQPGWQTRGHGPQTDVQAIVCHHTAGAPTGDAPSLYVVQNGRTGLAGPLSHFVLARSGTVYVVAAGLCWHAGETIQSWQSNPHSIGIEAEATGTAPWPDIQVKAYAKLCAALAKAFKIPASRVMGHKEVCYPVGRKSDPNFDMGSFRNRVTGYLSGDPEPSPQPEDKKGTAELMERITVTPPDGNEHTFRVNLSGTDTAGVVIRPRIAGSGYSEPMWVGHIYAWGNDKQGVGQDPAATPGYNDRLVSHRRYDLKGAVWADIKYSAAGPFEVDCF